MAGANRGGWIAAAGLAVLVLTTITGVVSQFNAVGGRLDVQNVELQQHERRITTMENDAKADRDAVARRLDALGGDMREVKAILMRIEQGRKP